MYLYIFFCLIVLKINYFILIFFEIFFEKKVSNVLLNYKMVENLLDKFVVEKNKQNIQVLFLNNGFFCEISHFFVYSC